jgi:HEAT repeat protein
MAGRSLWGLTPRQSIEGECLRRGTPEVVAGCLALIRAEPADDALVLATGGPPGRSILDGGRQYWLRVWGTRALLYAWDDEQAGDALDALTLAMTDEAWRVREMAAKVVARRRLGPALAAVAELQDDPVPRVRAAAARALAVLTAAGA